MIFFLTYWQNLSYPVKDTWLLYELTVSYCVFLVGLAVMSVDFGNEFMKIAIVKVSTGYLNLYNLC